MNNLREQEIEKINYPVALHTVDVLAFKVNQNKKMSFLFGRKANETKFQIPGGFVDPTDDSAEMAAVREFKEEMGIEIFPRLMYVNSPSNTSHILRYLGSFKIDDERYRNSVHKILTSLYTVQITERDIPIASDDLVEFKWISADDLFSETSDLTLINIVEKHHKLIQHIYYLINGL